MIVWSFRQNSKFYDNPENPEIHYFGRTPARFSKHFPFTATLPRNVQVTRRALSSISNSCAGRFWFWSRLPQKTAVSRKSLKIRLWTNIWGQSCNSNIKSISLKIQEYWELQFELCLSSQACQGKKLWLFEVSARIPNFMKIRKIMKFIIFEALQPDFRSIFCSAPRSRAMYKWLVEH